MCKRLITCKVLYACTCSFIQVPLKYQNHRMLEMEGIVGDQPAQLLYFKDEETET